MSPLAATMTTAAEYVAEEPDLDFDEPLGAAQGVVAYSNLDDYYFSGEKSIAFGVFMGYKYQCVEFARRYMLLRAKCIFGQCGPAAEIFDMTTVDHVETGETLPFIACKNGATTVKPAVGMTFIYPRSKKMPVGHVAVFSAVGEDWVGIAEQNQASKSWQGKPFGRQVPLRRNDDGTWYVEEPDPSMTPALGWLYVDGATYEQPLCPEDICSSVNATTLGLKVYRPPVVLPKFIAPVAPPKKMIHFKNVLAVPTLPEFSDAAHTDTIAARRRLVEKYIATLKARFEKTHQREAIEHHRAPSAHGPHYRRSAVARTAEWHSLYAPNEPLMIGGIGEGLKAYHLVERCVKELLFAWPPQQVAERFGMPLAAAEAAALHLRMPHFSTSALTGGDCLLGSMAVLYDDDTESYRVLHSELDSLNLVIDCNALQDEYATDHGLQMGFRMTGFSNDFNRGFKNLQKLRYGRPKADLPLTFLDFGSPETLETKYGFRFASDDDRYQYDIERLNHLYVAHTLIEFIASKEQTFKAGDLLEEDLPKWKVILVDDALAALDIREDGAFVSIEGQRSIPLSFVWKCAPWWMLFELSAQVPAAATLMEYVYGKRCDFILNPLWTHIASHPAFGRELSEWAEVHDAAKNDGDPPAAPMVLPVASWEKTSPELPVPCSYAVKPHMGAVNSETEMRQPSRVHQAADRQPASSFHPTTHMLLAAGKRAAAIALEGRFVKGEDSEGACCTIYDVVHPAPLAWMPFLHD